MNRYQTFFCLTSFVFCFIICFTNCTDQANGLKKRIKWFTHRDKSINKTNAVTDLFVDSLKMESFISQQHIDTATAQNIRSFYNGRNYQFAWFTKTGWSEPGISFWNLLNSFIHLTKDSTLFDTTLANQLAKINLVDSMLYAQKEKIEQTELALTNQFFIYAKVAYGGRIDPQELQWFIPRKKIDVKSLLDSMMHNGGKNPDAWAPINPQYQAMEKALIHFNEINENGGWKTIPPANKRFLRPGDSCTTILGVKSRLFIEGDLTTIDTTGNYDSVLYQGVCQAQIRFGFKPDGIIDSLFIKALNVPVEKRIEQLLINMERMRWLPEKQEPNRIVANIPEFKLHVIEQDTEALELAIVVGKKGNSTVIFHDVLKYIVFSPYWNVPYSIVKNEIMPAMKNNPNYLASHDMEKTSKGNKGVPSIRQKPGGKNALGKVKFLFPNNYNIYFHDTPSKGLFQRNKRAFSHGCMRLQNPKKLAQYLLRNQIEWTEEKIDAAMNDSKEHWVTLKNPLPVDVTYFTAWVDKNGLLNFRDDIYGHDQRTAERLFYKPSISAL